MLDDRGNEWLLAVVAEVIVKVVTVVVVTMVV